MYDTETETIATAGRYRVRIEPDRDIEPPDHDEQGYVFAVGYRSRWEVSEEHRDYSEDSAPSFDLADALERYGTDWQMVERYLRAFHDVVSFDYSELDRSGPTYVFVVTRAQAAAWGCEPADWPKLAGQSLATWRQWAEGDVWSYVIESRDTYHGEVTGASIDVWTVEDSLSGMYGREYAETEARAALASYDS